ncbi:MAG: ATP-binding protein [Bacteroidales bacterium]|jgi:two-component system phosphate regulon sensor histidine kinase PhoR
MKTTPRQLAILISLIISFVCATLVIMSLFLDIVHPLLMIIASIVIAFIIAFFLIYYAVNNFIFGKINPIYKTIENIPITKDELRKKLEGKDVIQEVNRMVINYAQNRAKEIKKLRRMEKYRKEFLGNVSHELKTPIFNIQGYILTLLDGGLEDPEINREYLERTEKSINRMVSIIEDLESITKLETGKLALEWEDFDIVQLVKYVYELQDSIRARFNIDFAFDRSYDKPIVVAGDKKRITEVLNNLIVNSIFYGNKGGKTTISFAEMGENILVDVTDNGLGLEEDEIPRIFERFYRTDKSRSRDRGGTGLGLSIVKHIIEAHNQTITVRSEPGSGSSFSFTLKKA